VKEVTAWTSEAAAAASASQRLVDRDAGEPGGEPGPSRELIEVAEGADVRVLHDVLGFGVVGEDGAGDAIEPLVVAAHEHLEQAGLAIPHAGHHLLVGQRRGRWWRRQKL
jgi:hypothetical protein